MVPNLEEVNPTDTTRVDDLTGLVTLGVSRKESRHRATTLVVRKHKLKRVRILRAIDVRLGPYDAKVESSAVKGIAKTQLADTFGSRAGQSARLDPGKAGGDPARHEDPVASDSPRKRVETTIVVAMKVGDDHGVKLKAVKALELLDDAVVGTDVDQDRGGTVLHQDSVTLSDVQYADPRWSEEAPSEQQTSASNENREHHMPDKPRVNARPPNEQGEGETKEDGKCHALRGRNGDRREGTGGYCAKHGNHRIPYHRGGPDEGQGGPGCGAEKAGRDAEGHDDCDKRRHQEVGERCHERYLGEVRDHNGSRRNLGNEGDGEGTPGSRERFEGPSPPSSARGPARSRLGREEHLDDVGGIRREQAKRGHRDDRQQKPNLT